MKLDDWQLADALDRLARQLDPPGRRGRPMVIRDPAPVVALLRQAHDRLLTRARRQPGRPKRKVDDPESIRLGARVLRWWLVLVSRYRLAGGNRGPGNWEQLPEDARSRLKRWHIIGPESPREAALSIVEREEGINAGTLRRFVADTAREFNFDLGDLAELARAAYAVRLTDDNVKTAVTALDIFTPSVRRLLKDRFVPAERRLKPQ